MRKTLLACAGWLLAVASAHAGPVDDCNQTADVDRQIRGCSQVIQQTPSNQNNLSIAYTRRGDALRRKGDMDRALADHTKAIQLNPRNADAYFNRGLAHYRMEKYDRAVADYDKAIQLDPRNGNAYVNRGAAYAAMQKYDQAMADYAKAIQLNPRNDAAYHNRGVRYAAMQRYDQAVAEYDKAIELNPRYADAYRNRGKAYVSMRRYDQAVADYTKAIELNPRDADAHINRGRAYREMKRYDEALADYDKAIALDPRNSAAYDSRGRLHATRQNYERAIADFTRAIEIDPRHGRAILARGFVHRNLGDYERAVLDYDAALPFLNGVDKGRAHLNRLRALGELKRAAAGLDDLMALAKGHPDDLQRVEYSRIRAVVDQLKEQKRGTDALQLLETLVGAGYQGNDPLQLGDGLKPLLMEQLVRLGRIDAVTRLIADLNQYTHLLRLRVDRQYAALWSRPAVLAVLQPQDFPARELTHAQKAAARNPRSIRALYGLVDALTLNARHTEAVTLGRTALADSSAYDKDPESEAWLRNRIADALVAEGSFDEAVAVLRPLLARDAAQETYLVSQFINLGIELYRHGRSQEAIDTAHKAQGHVSPYGRMWIQSVSVCALSRLDRTAEAETVLLEMQKTPEVNGRATLRALLCLRREDEAAALLVKLLQADASRAQTLMDLQDCRENPRQPALARELRATLVKVRERPEVRKVVDTAGLIIAEPVACGDRYGTR